MTENIIIIFNMKINPIIPYNRLAISSCTLDVYSVFCVPHDSTPHSKTSCALLNILSSSPSVVNITFAYEIM